MMKDAGLPAAAVMELVGHDSEHYTQVGKEALEKVANALPDLLNIKKPRARANGTKLSKEANA